MLVRYQAALRPDEKRILPVIDKNNKIAIKLILNNQNMKYPSHSNQAKALMPVI